MRISALYAEIVDRFAREYGTPLPPRVISIGDSAHGWGVRLNCTKELAENIEGFTAMVSWNGWPAGIVGVSGGIIAAGEAANELALSKWLMADVVAASN